MGIVGLSRHQSTFPIRETIMRRSIVSLFSFLAIALIALTGCQEPQNSIPGSVDSISVRVMNSTDAKTITPEGNVNISHYVITVINEAEGINQSSGYLAKGETYTVSGVPAGLWTATADAYIKNGNTGTDADYIKVASATSAETRVGSGEKAILTVTLDKLDDSLSGDITVILDMPAELNDNGDTFYYTYTITGIGQRSSYSHTTNTPLQGTVDANGNGKFTIDADVIGPNLNQGAYLLTVSVFNQTTETGSNMVRKGSEIMRLVKGLAASGTIDLDYQVINEDGFQIAVTDRIGDRLDLGNASFNVEGFHKDLTITVAYDGIPVDTPVDVYVDGVVKSIGADYTATSGSNNVSYVFSQMEPGRHVVTFILEEENSELGVGSLSVEVVMPYEFEFEPVGPFLDTDTDPVGILTSDIYELTHTEDGVLEITGADAPMSFGNRDSLDETTGRRVTYVTTTAQGQCTLTIDGEEVVERIGVTQIEDWYETDDGRFGKKTVRYILGVTKRVYDYTLIWDGGTDVSEARVVISVDGISQEHELNPSTCDWLV